MTTIEERVAKGVEILDRKYGPDWRTEIDPDTLDMADCCNCVLGQLYDGSKVHMDGFDAGVKELKLTYPERYGFDIEVRAQDAGTYTWDELREAWIMELSK